MKKPCEYCGCDLPLGVDKDTRRIRSRHFSSCKARPSLEVESPAPVPTSWMEMVTANLVREGVNKHKARELAEHFYSLAPAAAVQEGRDWSLLEATQESLREHIAEIKRLKAAQLAMPDAIIEAGESPDYRDGWNDCRQAMMEMMK